MNRTGTMKMKKVLYDGLLFLLVLANSSFGQFYEESRLSGAGNPYFSIELFRTVSDDMKSGQIYIYSNIVNDDLTFIKHDSLDVYYSKFEWEVAIMDEDEEQTLGSDNVVKEVMESDYKETNNREKKIFLSTNFDIPAGEYIVFVEMRDLITKKTVSRKVEIEMFDFENNQMDMSDILFVDEASTDSLGNPTRFTPRVEDNFSRESPYIYIYNEVYTKEVPATVSIRYQLLNNDEDVELDTLVFRELDKPLTSHVIKLDKQSLSRSYYRCVVQAKRGGDHVERFRGLTFYWISVPETHEDLAEALRQMRYILDGDSLDFYEEAPLEEQKAFFARFWAARDPNPDSETNELLVEYFTRVNFANREFSNYSNDGWLSDRGRILVKFGFPDDVERHPFEMDSVPYVIWRYYGLRKVFLFVDRSGFGDYRLPPEYQSEEYR